MGFRLLNMFADVIVIHFVRVDLFKLYEGEKQEENRSMSCSYHSRLFSEATCPRIVKNGELSGRNIKAED